MKLSSTAFKADDVIPSQYSCEGRDVSPALSWSDIPSETASIALIADDPDAPGKTWVHWVLYNLPPNMEGLPEGVPTDKKLENGAMQGITDFGRIGYGGPCPPHGHGTHHYHFKLYALDAILDLEPGVTKADLEAAMQHHILGFAELVGTYERP